MRFSNLRVDPVIAGQVNTGHLQVIDLAVSQIQHTGDLPLSHALWEFTQMVLESPEVEFVARREIIEGLASVADHMVTGQARPPLAAARAALAALDSTVSAIPGLASCWATLHPLITRVLA